MTILEMETPGAVIERCKECDSPLKDVRVQWGNLMFCPKCWYKRYPEGVPV